MRCIALLFGLVISALFSAGEARAYPAIVTADLVLRAGPGTNFPSLAVIPRGTRINAHNCGAGWCEVMFGPRRGFVSARFLTPSGAVASPPWAGPPPRDLPRPMPPRPWPGGGAACNERGASWARGEIATPGLAERARRDAGARIVRVIRPDDAITLEHNPQRLNLEVNAHNRIRNLRCG